MNDRYSITTDLAGQTRSLDFVFPAFVSAGFRFVHMCQHWTGEPTFFSIPASQADRQLADRLELQIADVHGFDSTESVGVPYNRELCLALHINRAQYAHEVGATTVVLHLPAVPAASLEEGIEEAVYILRILQPYYETLGVRAAVENLTRFPHSYAYYDAIFEQFAPEYLGFCYDSGHALIQEQKGTIPNHVDFLRRYVGRLFVTHLHDNDGQSDQHLLPGLGKVDWTSVMAILRESGYAGTLNLEVRQPDGTEMAPFCRQAYECLDRLWRQS